MIVNMNDLPKPQFTLPPQPEGYKHRFHAMVKPIGSRCNLDCTYCYYLHKEDLLHQPAAPRMSDEILEQHIRQYIEAQTGDEVVFSWQGGEPTLLGIDFFQKVVELQAEYKKPSQRIENDLQTNGTLLDADWVVFLKKHRFLVGLSCDGPARLHDQYRVTKGGQPTHDKVVAAARLLKKHDCAFQRSLCRQPGERQVSTGCLSLSHAGIGSVARPVYLLCRAEGFSQHRPAALGCRQLAGG